jgi:hypothetical protein
VHRIFLCLALNFLCFDLEFLLLHLDDWVLSLLLGLLLSRLSLVLL